MIEFHKNCIANIFSLTVKLLLVCFISLTNFMNVQAGNANNIDDKVTTNKRAEQVQFLFFGTSTFLIEDNENQIFIDSYLSRSSSGIWNSLKPNLKQIREIIDKYQLCPNIKVQLSSKDPIRCHAKKAPKLSLIIPTHGHYDHALDIGALALWSGAEVIGDASIRKIVEATSYLDSELIGSKNWRLPLEKFSLRPYQFKEPFQIGKFKITLFKTVHSTNPFSKLLKGSTKSSFRFPAPFWEMKEGTTISVLIEYKNKSYLFIPSAGDIGDSFKTQRIKADIVLLGIGGLCGKPIKLIKKYWENTVRNVSAKTVYLIHWDSSIGIIPYKNIHKSEKPTCLTKNIVKLFKKLSGQDSRVIKLPPILSPFFP